jgi:predicted nucleotidyltransferase
MTAISPKRTPDAGLIERLRSLLAAHPDIRLALLFGSLAAGTARAGSDIDIAAQADRPLSAEARLALMDELALAFGRPVDLIDLRRAGQPLLGQILAHGVRIVGTHSDYGDLIYRNIMDNADFGPCLAHILAARRRRWIGA